MKICMFVYNECKDDARVLKEAITLTQAGYEVRIIAYLSDKTVPYEERDDFRIFRVALILNWLAFHLRKHLPRSFEGEMKDATSCEVREGKPGGFIKRNRDHAKKKLGRIFKTKDFNIGLNIGKDAGSSIDHIHWQIIPRKYKVMNSSNIFADIHIITISPQKLKKMIEGK